MNSTSTNPNPAQPAVVYCIEYRAGRTARYATLAAAKDTAEKIFRATGIVVAITAQPAK